MRPQEPSIAQSWLGSLEGKRGWNRQRLGPWLFGTIPPLALPVSSAGQYLLLRLRGTLAAHLYRVCDFRDYVASACFQDTASVMLTAIGRVGDDDLVVSRDPTQRQQKTVDSRPQFGVADPMRAPCVRSTRPLQCCDLHALHSQRCHAGRLVRHD